MATQNTVQTPTEVLMTDVTDAANGVKAMASDAMAAVGSSSNKAAAAAHDVSEKVSDLAFTGAGKLERGGEYLHDLEFSDVRSDIKALIRRHPMQAVIVGLSLGFIAAYKVRA